VGLRGRRRRGGAEKGEKSHFQEKKAKPPLAGGAAYRKYFSENGMI